jgi:hypothetical protein
MTFDIWGFTLVLVRAYASGVEPAAKAHLLARPNCQPAHRLRCFGFGGFYVLCVACGPSVHTVGFGEEKESLTVNVSQVQL